MARGGRRKQRGGSSRRKPTTKKGRREEREKKEEERERREEEELEERLAEKRRIQGERELAEMSEFFLLSFFPLSFDAGYIRWKVGEVGGGTVCLSSPPPWSLVTFLI